MKNFLKNILAEDEKESPEELKEKIDKFKVLYEYYKFLYEDEKSRYSRLEDKSTKFLTFLAILSSTYFLFVRFYLFNDSSISDCFYFLNILLIITTIVLFSIAWYHTFMGLKIMGTDRLPSKKEFIVSFEKSSLPSFYVHSSKIFMRLVDDYRKIGAIKYQSVKKAYNFILLSGISFIISILLFIFSRIGQ